MHDRGNQPTAGINVRGESEPRPVRKTYCILGGGGCFGVHTSLYLLDHANPRKVIGIGRSPLRGAPFSLGVEKRPGYVYHPYHITYELDLLLNLLDEEKPEIIINFAAQGEGAASWENSWRYFETNSMGLSKLCEQLAKRSWLERFVHIGTSEIYGSVSEPAHEDAPLKPTSPYAASKLAFDMYLVSVHKFLGFPMNIIRPSNAYCPGQMLHRVIPKAIWSGLKGERLPLHGARPRGKILHPRARPRARDPSGHRARAARHDLQCRPRSADSDPRGGHEDRAGARPAAGTTLRDHRGSAGTGFQILARQHGDPKRGRLGADHAAG
jgi:hypothetical protein